MEDDFFKKELDKIEEQITTTEKEFIKNIKNTFDKINKDIKENDQKNKFKIKVDTEQQLDIISRKFNELQNLEVKRREMMLKKLKQDQTKANEKFKNLLKSFREQLFSQTRNNLSDNTSINNFLKEMIKLEQQIVLAKNEDTYNIILGDLSLFQLSTKYYQNTNMSKLFLRSINNNFKLLESMGNYQDTIDYIDGILSISQKIVENKADILHKYSMKLFKEGKFNEAQKKMELALKTTKDSRGKKLLQFELDKVVLTNMHANPKNYKNFNFEEAIKICDRLLESPYLKDKNREKIKAIKNMDIQKLEQFKKNSTANKELIHEEVNYVEVGLNEE